tara:strand:+ start:889 stop:1239 length:351 start_codon:yes stop_codon:yes gene_type:complete
MKEQIKKWKEFLSETRDSIQDSYEARFALQLTTSEKIDRTEVMSFIRAIPNVTTVQNDGKISSSGKYYVAAYTVRFVLPRGSDAQLFYFRSLKPSLNKIMGLTIQRDRGFKKVEQA